MSLHYFIVLVVIVLAGVVVISPPYPSPSEVSRRKLWDHSAPIPVGAGA